MQGSLHCRVVEGGWIEMSIKAPSDNDFTDILERLKFDLHVIQYDKKLKRYKTSAYELQRLSDLCEKYKIELFATEKVIRADARLRFKNKYIERMGKKNHNHLKIPLWTEDPDMQPFEYQKYGIAMGVYLKKMLLGDDMGVGKTVQAIGIVLKAWETYDLQHALIVCPPRLTQQWRKEILLFTKLRRNQVTILGERTCRSGERTHFVSRAHACRDCKYFDACKFDAEAQKSSAADFRALQIKRSKVLICGYQSIRMHCKDFIKNPYYVVIFDEATFLKNRKADVTKCASAYVDSLPAYSVVIPMSGTFIENRIEELYSIMNIANPRVLGGFDNFKTKYLVTDYFGNVTGYRNEKVLKDKLDKMLIRRTVDEVWKDRPPLIETTIECPMGPEQAKVYAEIREGVLESIADKQKERAINMAQIANLIAYLLQVSNTVKSIDPDTEIKQHSAKFEMIKEMIKDEFPRKAKIIIFTHYAKKVLPHLVKEIEGLKMGEVRFIRGGTKDKVQAQIVHDFETKENFRFLICSDAVAYGANFQFANYMINLDLPWNPAKLDQRIRRIYRRGQKKTVTIITLYTPDTFEGHVFQLNEQKRKLFRTFLKESVVGTETSRKELSVKDLIGMI